MNSSDTQELRLTIRKLMRSSFYDDVEKIAELHDINDEIIFRVEDMQNYISELRELQLKNHDRIKTLRDKIEIGK